MAYGASLVPGSRLVGSDFGLDISSVLVIKVFWTICCVSEAALPRRLSDG